MGRVPVILLAVAGCVLVSACVISEPRKDWDMESEQRQNVLMDRMHSASSVKEMQAIQKELDDLHSEYYYDLTFEPGESPPPPLQSEEERKKAADEAIDRELEELRAPPSK